MPPGLPEFARFLFAGAVNTGISYAAYLLLLTVLPYLAAYAISYLLGIVLSYLLLTRFVFRAPPRLSTAVRFPLVYVAQYLLGSAVLALLVAVRFVGWRRRPWTVAHPAGG